MNQSTVSIFADISGLIGLMALLLYVGTDRQVARRPPFVLALVVGGCAIATVIRVVLLFNL